MEELKSKFRLAEPIPRRVFMDVRRFIDGIPGISAILAITLVLPVMAGCSTVSANLSHLSYSAGQQGWGGVEDSKDIVSGDGFKYLAKPTTEHYQVGGLEPLTEGSKNSVISIHYPISLNSLIVTDPPCYANPDITVRTAVYDYESPERVLLSDILPGRSLEHMTEPDEPRGLGYPRAPGSFPYDLGYEEPSNNNPGNDDLGVGAQRPIREIDPGKPMVALTFDDGPFPKSTESILDTLKAHDAVATFFVLGNRVSVNGALLSRMLSEGSEIGNHSFNHKQLTTLTLEELQKEIYRTQEAIKEVTGYEPVVMRPTYGSYDEDLRDGVDMPMILWSLDTRDWENRDAGYVCKKVLENVEDGDIILMHDIYVSTANAVKTIVPELKSRGYQLVTVSELHEAKGVALETGKVYHREAKK